METSSSDQLRSYSKPVNESHLDLLSHGKLSDVTFIVGPSKEKIPCHQAFLIARSPVFDAMFSERWNQDINKEIPLENIDPKIFKKFLQFIYADTIVANVPETLELLHLAHFYDVQLLVSKCEELLLENEVTVNDVLDVFHAAHKYDTIQLMDKADDSMAKLLSELQSHPSFLRVDKETLVYILKRNVLNMKEVDLFRLTMKWANNQCDGLTLEQSLEEILPLIRFPVMTLEELTSTVVPTGLLSQSTLFEIFIYLGSDAETKKSLASTLKFNTRRRRSTDSIHDLYAGDLAKMETRRLQLEKLGDWLIILTRITGRTAYGIGGISVYCPARAVSAASGPVSFTFKEFSIVLESVRKVNVRFVSDKILLSMSPVKVEDGEITEIQFDTIVPLANESAYRLTVVEIPRSRGQPAAHIDDFSFVKVFGRQRNRCLTIDIINKSVVIDGIQKNEAQNISDSIDKAELPQLICGLIVEKL